MSQKDLGLIINKTKKGVASIYRRSTIEIELLMLISHVLDYDFFSDLYEKDHLKKFKHQADEIWEKRVSELNAEIESLKKMLDTKDELLTLQKKYIIELEEKAEGRSN